MDHERKCPQCGEPPDDKADGLWRKWINAIVGTNTKVAAQASGVGTTSAERTPMRTRVLVVDEDEDYTRRLQENLEGSGKYEVFIEKRSPNAAQAALTFKPHVVVLNVIMPVMFGGDVVDQFQADPALRDIPIILLTPRVHIRPAHIRDGAIGGYPILFKATALPEVMATIDKYARGL